VTQRVIDGNVAIQYLGDQASGYRKYPGMCLSLAVPPVEIRAHKGFALIAVHCKVPHS